MGGSQTCVRPRFRRTGLAILRPDLRLAAVFLHLLQRAASGVDRVGRTAHIRDYSDPRVVPWEAILLLDLRMRRAGGNGGRPVAPSRSQGQHVATVGVDERG